MFNPFYAQQMMMVQQQQYYQRQQRKCFQRQLEAEAECRRAIVHSNPFLRAQLETQHQYRVNVSRYTGMNKLTLYHQTDAASANSILRSQRFRPGSKGAAGGGIYFADSAAATYQKTTSYGPILVAEVSLGNCGVMWVHGNQYPSDFDDEIAQGYDSILLKGFSSGDEYVIFDPSQISHIRQY